MTCLARIHSDEEGEDQRLTGKPEYQQSFLQPIVGTLQKEDQLRLKKLIFRTTRGKAFVQFSELCEKVYDYNGRPIELSVYFVIYP